MKHYEVVCAIIYNNENKIFCTKRGPGRALEGKWEFPGGKVEKDESEEHAIEREIMEELETKVKAISFVTNNICEYPDKTIDLRLYKCEYISGDFKLSDHSEIKFVNKNELLDYDLAPADIPLAEYIVKNL